MIQLGIDSTTLWSKGKCSTETLGTVWPGFTLFAQAYVSEDLNTVLISYHFDKFEDLFMSY